MCASVIPPRRLEHLPSSLHRSKSVPDIFRSIVRDLDFRPQQYVDYLSYPWSDDELTDSWRVVTKLKNRRRSTSPTDRLPVEMALGIIWKDVEAECAKMERLEYISWRFVSMQRKYRLEKLHPHAIDWAKDTTSIFVTGPLITKKNILPDHQYVHSPTKPSSVCSSQNEDYPPSGKKSALKRVTVRDLLNRDYPKREPSLGYDSSPSRSPANSPHLATSAPSSETACGSVTSFSLSPTLPPTSPQLSPTRPKCIRFNGLVEQRVIHNPSSRPGSPKMSSHRITQSDLILPPSPYSNSPVPKYSNTNPIARPSRQYPYPPSVTSAPSRASVQSNSPSSPSSTVALNKSASKRPTHHRSSSDSVLKRNPSENFETELISNMSSQHPNKPFTLRRVNSSTDILLSLPAPPARLKIDWNGEDEVLSPNVEFYSERGDVLAYGLDSEVQYKHLTTGGENERSLFNDVIANYERYQQEGQHLKHKEDDDHGATNGVNGRSPSGDESNRKLNGRGRREEDILQSLVDEFLNESEPENDASINEIVGGPDSIADREPVNGINSSSSQQPKKRSSQSTPHIHSDSSPLPTSASARRPSLQRRKAHSSTPNTPSTSSSPRFDFSSSNLQSQPSTESNVDNKKMPISSPSFYQSRSSSSTSSFTKGIDKSGSEDPNGMCRETAETESGWVGWVFRKYEDVADVVRWMGDVVYANK
ncbi:hypothetical protein BKA69DRAFT_1063094 [Paraphysoderma sedebokerense]|nr:hypothetical protein BKA69DRAFT_1063094 [Paraphysoderma sedebokerense]